VVQRDSIVDTEDDDNSSTGAAAEENNSKKKIKKKKKKKNKNGNPAAAASSIVENASTRTATDLSEQKTPNRRNTNVMDVAVVSSADPLISALEGMGFDHHQVLAGIEACGGSARATADDVVAWIFGSDTAGGGNNELPPAPAQSNKSEEQQSSKTRTKDKETPSVHSISKSEAERRNMEAAKQLEEERLAAEKLAAKREEQRRRNREWNNRAQARQAMEAQDRVAKASSMKAAARLSANPLVLSTGLKTGIAPTTNFLSGVRGPAVAAAAGSITSSTTPTFNAATHKVTRIETNPARRDTTASAGAAAGGLQGQLKVDSGIDKALSNDASTVASSLGPTMFEVEITNNDDATVSTMGSFPAVPQLSAPNLIPPGFDSDGIPIFDGLQQRETSNVGRWDAMQRSSSFGDMHVSSHSFSPFASVQMGPPPGIPESGPLMDRLVQHNERAQSFSIPYGSRHMSIPTPSQRSFSTGATHYGTGGMADISMRSSESSHMAHTEASASHYLPGGFSRTQPPVPMSASNMGISPGSHHDFGNDGSAIPGLMGFGNPLNQGVPLDSAIIDSISTSNTVLGVSDLWGDSKVMGSSLLDTLLESSRTPTESSTGVVPASAFFPSSESLHSGGEQRIPGTWQNGLLSRSQSVSSSGGGTGGPAARSGSIW
jgi:hypothetical protein